MPVFTYRVRDKSGQSVVGTIEAPTPIAAGDQLYNRGYLPVSIQESKPAPSFDFSDLWSWNQRVSLKELTIFSQQLSTLYKAGLPLLTGLEGLKEQTQNKKLKSVLEDIHQQIEGGTTLFGSMSKHPDVFPFVYVNMIRAGESSGRLGESLDRFVTLAERQLNTRQKLMEATRYPIMTVVVLAIAVVALVLLVFPRFAAVFSKFNTDLPLPTRILIAVGNHWYLMIAAMLILLMMVLYLFLTEQGKQLWSRLKTRIPFINSLFLKIALSRFAYTFVMLNRSGITIIDTLEITSSTVDHIDLSKSIERITGQIKEGSSLTDAMRDSGRFTPLVLQMVSVGESSGTLDEMLMRITEYYDIEVENSIKKMSVYIEPLLMLFMGLIVLFLALAVFLPWWNMASLFRS